MLVVTRGDALPPEVVLAQLVHVDQAHSEQERGQQECERGECRKDHRTDTVEH